MEPLKPFTVSNLREITDQYEKEEISFSRMVEMLNEKAKEFYDCLPFRTCENCKYSKLGLADDPCFSCINGLGDKNKWEPQ